MVYHSKIFYKFLCVKYSPLASVQPLPSAEEDGEEEERSEIFALYSSSPSSSADGRGCTQANSPPDVGSCTENVI